MIFIVNIQQKTKNDSWAVLFSMFVAECYFYSNYQAGAIFVPVAQEGMIHLVAECVTKVEIRATVSVDNYYMDTEGKEHTDCRTETSHLQQMNEKYKSRLLP